MNIIEATKQELRAVEAQKYEGFTNADIRRVSPVLRAAIRIMEVSTTSDSLELMRSLCVTKVPEVNIVARHILEILR